MKDMNKNKLAITRLNDGSFDIQYHLENNVNNSYYDNFLMVNIMTKEQFYFKDLILRVDGNDIYLYPERSRSNRRKEENFKLINWIFVDDSRTNRVMAAAEEASKIESDKVSRWNQTSNYFTRSGEVKPTLSIFNKEKEDKIDELGTLVKDLVHLGDNVSKALDKISDIAGETKYDLKKSITKIKKDLEKFGIKF